MRKAGWRNEWVERPAGTSLSWITHQLSLSVTSDDLVLLSRFQESLPLLVSTLVLQSGEEHSD